MANLTGSNNSNRSVHSTLERSNPTKFKGTILPTFNNKAGVRKIYVTE